MYVTSYLTEADSSQWTLYGAPALHIFKAEVVIIHCTTEEEMWYAEIHFYFMYVDDASIGTHSHLWVLFARVSCHVSKK